MRRFGNGDGDGDGIPSSGAPGTRLLGNTPETSTLPDDGIGPFYIFFIAFVRVGDVTSCVD